MDNGILMGKMIPTYKNGTAKNITFCVTEDCNLACKYCYMTGKNHKQKMTLETGKKAVDYILTEEKFLTHDAVVWDFIGGEPFLEIELIDKLCDYIKYKMYELNHKWFNNYRFAFSTNGLLYDNPKVQNYIRKNIHHLSIGISVDGNKIKHDLQRVKPNGEGSYDELIPKVKLWLKQFPDAGTKATFAHDDLPYLKDSVISLWDLGLKYVSANVIFEDVWEDGDDEIFENQLKELADYIIDNELWNEKTVRFFDPNLGLPVDSNSFHKNFCGSGNVLTIGCDGTLYPCIRFLDFSLNNCKGKEIGNLQEGINMDRVKPFLELNTLNQSENECLTCEVGRGCAWCTGYNYDQGETIFTREIAICKMHKANVRANQYFWDKLEYRLGRNLRIDKNEELKKLSMYKSLYNLIKPTKDMNDKVIVLTGKEENVCCVSNPRKKIQDTMSDEIRQKVLQFCKDRAMEPIFSNKNGYGEVKVLDEIFDQVKEDTLPLNSNLIINLHPKQLSYASNIVNKLLNRNNSIDIRIMDIDSMDLDNIQTYITFLRQIKDHTFIENLKIMGIMISQDETKLCEAQEKKYTIAPNGKIYVCPAFYYNDPNNFIGDIEQGITLKHLENLQNENFNCYNSRTVEGCSKCFYLNKKVTGEYMIPGNKQEILESITVKLFKNLKGDIIND